MEIVNIVHGAALTKLNNINGVRVQVAVNNDLSVSKGIIHVYGYNMVNFERQHG